MSKGDWFKITKDALSNLHVINQLDKKFIVCYVDVAISLRKTRRVVTLFDQHAVSERIELEKLIKDYCNQGGSKTVQKLDEKIALAPKSSEMEYIKKFQRKFEHFGLHFEIVDGIKQSQILIDKVPGALYEKSMKENGMSIKCLLAQFIYEIISIIETTEGRELWNGWLPKVIKDQLCMAACKGDSRMFNVIIKQDAKSLALSLKFGNTL